MLKTSVKSTSLLNDIRCLLTNSIHSCLDVLRRNEREDRSIDDGQFLDAIEEKLLGHATTHIFRQHRTAARWV